LATSSKGADSVELKLTIPESEGRSALAALGIDPLQAQVRQVFFFDTPSLTLNQVPAELGVPGRRRVQGVPDRAGGRLDRQAADQD
jgi:hypothetical protein